MAAVSESKHVGVHCSSPVVGTRDTAGSTMSARVIPELILAQEGFRTRRV
jgi:hypothetical protein